MEHRKQTFLKDENKTEKTNTNNDEVANEKTKYSKFINLEITATRHQISIHLIEIAPNSELNSMWRCVLNIVHVENIVAITISTS